MEFRVSLLHFQEYLWQVLLVLEQQSIEYPKSYEYVKLQKGVRYQHQLAVDSILCVTLSFGVVVIAPAVAA